MPHLGYPEEQVKMPLPLACFAGSTIAREITLCSCRCRRAAFGCSTLQHTATHCTERAATHCSTVQHTHAHTLQQARYIEKNNSCASRTHVCHELELFVAHCNKHAILKTLQHTAPHTLQHTATHCNTHTATHCNECTATHCASKWHVHP